MNIWLTKRKYFVKISSIHRLFCLHVFHFRYNRDLIDVLQPWTAGRDKNTLDHLSMWKGKHVKRETCVRSSVHDIVISDQSYLHLTPLTIFFITSTLFYPTHYLTISKLLSNIDFVLLRIQLGMNSLLMNATKLKLC